MSEMLSELHMCWRCRENVIDNGRSASHLLSNWRSNQHFAFHRSDGRSGAKQVLKVLALSLASLAATTCHWAALYTGHFLDVIYGCRISLHVLPISEPRFIVLASVIYFHASRAVYLTKVAALSAKFVKLLFFCMLNVTIPIA